MVIDDYTSASPGDKGDVIHDKLSSPTPPGNLETNIINPAPGYQHFGAIHQTLMLNTAASAPSPPLLYQRWAAWYAPG